MQLAWMRCAKIMRPESVAKNAGVLNNANEYFCNRFRPIRLVQIAAPNCIIWDKYPWADSNGRHPV